MTKTALAVVLALVAGVALAVVPSTVSRVDVTGNGSTSAFTFSFPVITSSAHVEVLLAGVKQSSGYTVTLNANQVSSPGGTVAFTSPPAAGVAVRIQRTVPLTQDTVYTPYSAFPAKTTEKALDRIVQQQQQLDRKIDDQAVVRHRGAWSYSTTYSQGDVVTYMGASYLATAANQGKSPDASTEWGVLAVKGDVGIPGPSGPSGAGPAFGNSGVDLYVNSSTGNDANDCATWTSACRTILGAYDKLTSSGGTINFADQSWVGGEVANQGLWFIGNNDPAWPTVPAGFRAQKPVRFRGHGRYNIQFGAPTGARIVAGQGGSWEADNRNKPAIHLAGTFTPFVFENVVVANGPARPVIIGEKADLSTYAISMVATQWFNNCQFQVTGNATDTNRGPVVEIGYGFWVYFNDSVFHAYNPTDESLPKGDDRHAAVLIKDSGLQFFYGGRWAQGGVKSYMPGVVMSDILVESYAPALPPVFWAMNYANGGGVSYSYVRNVGRADAANGSYPDVQIDSSGIGTVDTTQPYQAAAAGPYQGKNIVVDCGWTCTVKGPATLHGGAIAWGETAWSAGASTKSYRSSVNRQAGVIQGRLLGEHDGARRTFGPVRVPFTNIASTSWTTNGERTISRVPGPDGRATSAWRAAPLIDNAGLIIVPYQAKPFAVGDRIIFGLWVRLPSGGRSAGAGNNNGSIILGSANAANKFNNGSDWYVTGVFGPSGDGEWKWVYAAGTVTTGGVSTDLSGGIYLYDHNYPVEWYGAVAYYIPAGTISDNEFGELMDALAYHAPSAPVGSRSMDGDLYLWDGAIRQGGTTFANLGTPANGTLWYCTDCTIANPCAGSGTGAFAKRLNGVWVCN